MRNLPKWTTYSALWLSSVVAILSCTDDAFPRFDAASQRSDGAADAHQQQDHSVDGAQAHDLTPHADVALNDAALLQHDSATPLDAQSHPADLSVTPDAALHDAAPKIPDAASADAAVASTWCASQTPPPAFCADFDTTATVGENWVPTESHGSLSFDTTTATSAPRSARAVSENNTSSVVQAMLAQGLSETVAQFVFAFDIRPETIANGATIVAGDVTLTDSSFNLRYGVQLLIEQGAAYLEERVMRNGSPQFARTALSSSLALGQWTRVTIDAKMPTVTSAGQITVRFGNTTVLNALATPPRSSRRPSNFFRWYVDLPCRTTC